MKFSRVAIALAATGANAAALPTVNTEAAVEARGLGLVRLPVP